MNSATFLNVAAVVRHCRNWPAVLSARLRRTAPDRIVLRKAGRLSTTSDTDLWNHFSDIWLHKSYGDPSELRGSAVIDCGANVGLFTLYALAHNASRVISVEPAAHVYEALKENTHSYRDRCNVIQAAVADEPGSGWFRNAPDSTASSLVTHPNDGDVLVVTVTLPMLLDELQGNPGQIFLKIDCEGAEGSILSGAGPRLREVTYIALEYHSLSSRDRCREILESTGCFEYAEWGRDREYGMMFAQNVGEDRGLEIKD